MCCFPIRPRQRKCFAADQNRRRHRTPSAHLLNPPSSPPPTAPARSAPSSIRPRGRPQPRARLRRPGGRGRSGRTDVRAGPASGEPFFTSSRARRPSRPPRPRGMRRWGAGPRGERPDRPPAESARRPGPAVARATRRPAAAAVVDELHDADPRGCRSALPAADCRPPSRPHLSPLTGRNPGRRRAPASSAAGGPAGSAAGTSPGSPVHHGEPAQRVIQHGESPGTPRRIKGSAGWIDPDESEPVRHAISGRAPLPAVDRATERAARSGSQDSREDQGIPSDTKISEG